MEESIACVCRQTSGAVLLASDKTRRLSKLTVVPQISAADLPNAGKFQDSSSFGVRSLQRSQEPLTQDTPMWIASFTKLMTTIAVLQCVEERKFSLDTDVTSILYELKDLEISTDFDESAEPTLKQKDGRITVQLVTCLSLVWTSLTQIKDTCSHMLRDCFMMYFIPYCGDGVT